MEYIYFRSFSRAKLKTTVGPEIEEEENDKDLSQFPIGIVPPKTNDRSKMITATDKRNFKALCRGLELLPIEETSKLKCYYQLMARDPYFWLHPMKVGVEEMWLNFLHTKVLIFAPNFLPLRLRNITPTHIK